MKAWQKWLVGLLSSLIIIIGIGVAYKMNQEKQLREEMIRIVESEEVKKLFEEELKSLDTKALTEQGKIKSYEVDYDSFNKNPMGGFSVELILNNDYELSYRLGINRRQRNDELYIYSWIKSDKLVEIFGD
ncbi:MULTISPECIES: DUF1310 family protein [Streptococcus]|uniref:DUF1310 family protein n=1 Tax=Streptococcus TaxID=1301 RepID=UPI0012DE09E2|nr:MULTISPECIES: DUF1310 family protein [Streptococcus]QHF54382.1 hypothetical protein BZG42_02975 [Streptococcus sp. DAT741]